MFALLCALALTSMESNDMTPCEELAAAIKAEQDPAARAALEEQYKAECVEDPQGSGGHGHTMPGQG